MLISLIGSFGIGLVWGWMVGIASFTKKNRVFTWTRVSAGFALISILVYLLASLSATSTFILASGCAFIAYNIWIYELRQLRNHRSHFDGGIK